MADARLLAAVLLLALPATAAADGAPPPRSAAVNYLLHCSGCHMTEGTGLPAAGIPAFPGFIDTFAARDDGRTYIAHVPGVVGTSLPPDELAALVNYIVDRWGTADVAPFTPEELAARRAIPVPDVVAYRRAVVARLAAEGVPIADYPWP